VIWQELHFPIGFHLREQLSAERGRDIRLGQAGKNTHKADL
jgi:hypothetical protein